jgi:hypothetical protein
MKNYKVALLLLAIGCCDAMAKCPMELKGSSRARLEAAAASVADATLAPDTLRACVFFKVGIAHIATVTTTQPDGSETWTGVNCNGERSGHGQWYCSAKEYRGISVTLAPGARDERVTIAEDTDPHWARRMTQSALLQLAGAGDLPNCEQGREPVTASLKSVRLGIDRYQAPLELNVLPDGFQLRREISRVRFEVSPEADAKPRLKCFGPGTVPR